MEKLYGKQLEIMATKARLLGLDAVHTAASGHIGGSFLGVNPPSGCCNLKIHPPQPGPAPEGTNGFPLLLCVP